MNRYPVVQLIKLWERAAITESQAIGQLLLYVEHLVERVNALERSRVAPQEADARPSDETAQERKG